jgi:polar amino acid transport system substrate-binding protein
MRNPPPFLLLAVSCCLVHSQGLTQEPLTVAFNERPPYLVQREDGTPGGLTGTPALRAFQHAGVKVQWLLMPTNRQIAIVRDNLSALCVVGWFATAERRRFAKFTKPIYRDQPWMVLANADFLASERDTLAQVLARRGTRVLVKDKYSYGAEIDALLQSTKPTIAVSTGTTVQMLQSLAANTVDMMFVSEEEGRFLMSSGGPAVAHLRLLRFAAMPAGETRHIMCSMQVTDELMARLNKAILTK